MKLLTLNQLRPLIVVGTRPEAIKLAPVVREFRERQRDAQPIVCFTGQHREMVTPVAEYFGLEPDVNLNLMRPNQSLTKLTSLALERLDETIDQWGPNCVIAQGDTTSVLASSIAAFYRKIPFIHVEAGLRTHNIESPWPEEFNRRVASITAALHCAPTHEAAKNLLAEGVDYRKIEVCGNTVVDSLLWTLDRERRRSDLWECKHPQLGESRCVLITVHRRENFGTGIEGVCRAIARLADMHPDIRFVCPVHLNPNVRDPVHRLLSNISNVDLIQPLVYPEFVWLMDRSVLILTDSGGIQEEAPSLGKPTLVLRDSTERPEGLAGGVVRLVGTCEEQIVEHACHALAVEDEFRSHIPCNPYGDGKSSRRIVDRITSLFQEGRETLRRAA